MAGAMKTFVPSMKEARLVFCSWAAESDRVLGFGLVVIRLGPDKADRPGEY